VHGYAVTVSANMTVAISPNPFLGLLFFKRLFLRANHCQANPTLTLAERHISIHISFLPHSRVTRLLCVSVAYKFEENFYPTKLVKEKIGIPRFVPRKDYCTISIGDKLWTGFLNLGIKITACILFEDYFIGCV
jgi:hypothetical protein